MPKRGSYRLDKLEMPELEALLPEARKTIMRQAGKIVALRTRELAPDSGHSHKNKLNRTVKLSVRDNGLTAAVRVTAPHAHLIILGVSKHWITRHSPKDGHEYNWAWHPGLKPNQFLIQAYKETSDMVEGVMRAGVIAAAQAVADGATK